MLEMREMCARHGIRVPTPTVDARGRAVYKTEIADPMTMVVAGREMALAGCKPSARLSQWNDSTVVLTENRRREAWIFKHYARSREHAEAVLDDVLTAVQTKRQYQGELWL